MTLPRDDEIRESDRELSERQRRVLEAVATGYLFDATPISSGTVATLLPVKISSASIRSTMAELTELGLLEKRHASAGRILSDRGLRHFVETLLEPAVLGAWEQRSLVDALDVLPKVATDTALRQTTDVLSDYTGQLGFVLAPGIGSVCVRHVSLVRVSTERVLAVVVSSSGQAHQRILDDPGVGDQAELDRIAAVLNESVAGSTLAEIHSRLSRDLERMRNAADKMLRRAVELGLRICEESEDEVDLVIATRLALLEQPEFRDPARLRELFAALGTREQLVDVLDRILASKEVSVTFGDDLDEAGLHRCALIAAPFGHPEISGAGRVVGVIGPSRMDYGRIIPMVKFCSQILTEKLNS